MAKRVSAGSLNLRITFGSAMWLVAAFAVLDLILVGFEAAPHLKALAATGLLNSRTALQAFVDTVTAGAAAPKYFVVFTAEMVMFVLKVCFGSLRVRRILRPVQDLSDLAGKLENMDGSLNEEALHAVEAAINRVDAGGEGGVDTGYDELSGLEQAVNSLLQRTRASYQQQTRFVSDASHELRTPIAVIKGYADLLDRWGKTDEKVLDEAVAAIRSESNQMNYLVEQLLFLARGDSGKTKVNPERFDLFDLLNEVHSEYEMIDADHEFRFAAQGPIPAVGDVKMIKQAARILIDNAVKYSPADRPITLKAGRGEGGRGAWFSVQDNGIGIAPDALPRLFDRFYRVDDARSGEARGTGLGLSIAKWIVDRHNGTIQVRSAEDVGTCFTVTLP